ncbi:S-receptor-like serine/threonine-protein kinase [Quillaja saponaria]|uniref:Receptor-like serine/threonine-protein kinase n=1 Tax=Quillaja saponaria TaxID=32244 RepID=A0AAD7PD31_QUISA|nr:S-receptor-like serine/threonine-protein kinase [Quillaja saponaria]
MSPPTTSASMVTFIFLLSLVAVTIPHAVSVPGFEAKKVVSASFVLQNPQYKVSKPNSRLLISSNSTTTCRKALTVNPTLIQAKLPPEKSKFVAFGSNGTESRRSKKMESNSTVLIRGNKTILSENGTFQLGFFNISGKPNWYLGIWYSLIPSPTYVWVANRDKPITNPTGSTLEIIGTGQLAVKDSENSIIWQTTNTETSTGMKLLESGNLVLLTSEGTVSWQSFNHPTDTWLPGMNLTTERFLVSWRSLSDPSPGLYSLRLKQSNYGEFELLFNGTKPYWSTGNWTGEAFSNVPEMTMPYIYQFHFIDPFKPTASFGFSERPLDSGLIPPLTRFQMKYSGQLRQFTWTPQTLNWNMFWSRPENQCRVYGLCGKFGVCSNSNTWKPCDCLLGFKPVDDDHWDSDDYSGGCHREGDNVCSKNDIFERLGILSYEGAKFDSFPSTRSVCERVCLNTCSCIGLSFNEMTSLCKTFYGSFLSLGNLTAESSGEEGLFVRVQGGNPVKKRLNLVLLTASIVGSVAILGITGVSLLMLLRRRKKGVDEDGTFPVLNLKVFSYKELQLATRGFSDKLGHGGFGTVFQGELSDSTVVAVKRLERPGGGEKEFRAEVCTIGNIQHLNLVKLSGFCSENSHRLLVYEYMPNGPLSAYLRQEGPSLSWDVKFRVAIGTARGIAYLHEECRDCIIHCDIKPENILLDDNYTAKVSDFGLAKLLGRDFSRVLATMRGTWGYVAPEWISGVPITTKADVYSYGMTLLELIGGRRNVEEPPSSGGKGGGCGGGEKWFFPPWAAQQIIEGNVAAVIDKRLGSAYKMEEAERVALVAVWCIQDDEARRPTMGMVVKMLEGLVEVTVPPPPKLLQALVSGDSFHGVKADSSSRVSTGGFSRQHVEVSSIGSDASLGGLRKIAELGPILGPKQ